MIIFTCLLVAGGAQPAKAQNSEVYTVKGVVVDVQGNSAIDARKKAFAEARRKAYGLLADKLLPAEKRPNLVMPDDAALAAMVRDFEIVQEKMTTKRYAGTLDIRFTPAAVKKTMQVSDKPQTQAEEGETLAPSTLTGGDTQPEKRTSSAFEDPESYIYSPAKKSLVKVADGASAKPAVTAPERTTVLVLPWFGPIGRQTLWGDNNPWREAWENDQSVTRDASMPVVLAVGDVADVRDYSPPQPLSRRGDIAALMARYAATQAVLALAEQSADGVLFVSLYQFDNGAPIPVGRFNIDASMGGNPFAQAVRQTVASLRGLPGFSAGAVAPQTPDVPSVQAARSQMAIAPVGPAAAKAASAQYKALARFSGLQQWVSMRQALARLDGVSGMSVRAISPSQASVEFSYDGGIEKLASLLGQQGLSLEPAPQAAGAGQPAQYTLAYKREF